MPQTLHNGAYFAGAAGGEGDAAAQLDWPPPNSPGAQAGSVGLAGERGYYSGPLQWGDMGEAGGSARRAAPLRSSGSAAQASPMLPGQQGYEALVGEVPEDWQQAQPQQQAQAQRQQEQQAQAQAQRQQEQQGQQGLQGQQEQQGQGQPPAQRRRPPPPRSSQSSRGLQVPADSGAASPAKAPGVEGERQSFQPRGAGIYKP